MTNHSCYQLFKEWHLYFFGTLQGKCCLTSDYDVQQVSEPQVHITITYTPQKNQRLQIGLHTRITKSVFASGTCTCAFSISFLSISDVQEGSKPCFHAFPCSGLRDREFWLCILLRIVTEADPELRVWKHVLKLPMLRV